MLDRQFEIFNTLNSLTIKQAYENQGYRYTNEIPTREITRGIVALANAGPDQNGPEFFIALEKFTLAIRAKYSYRQSN